MDMVKNLVYMVEIMKETQRNHGILLEEVVQRLRNKGIILSHPKGMPQIPLENINEAERMEECLASSAAQMEYLTKRLSTEGGTSVEGRVDRIMRKLLTRAVGSLYSYMGRRQKGNDPKLAFSPTNMYKAVKDAVLLVHPDANGRIIDKSIMDYLRYSLFRTKK
ncbi:uncharacterized protein LOC112457248 [Temnothorax curvispinosus]|uniref:Uncharacterized protein LOC112457248 n=1 Tax=Temnothorax curvispinosus TaxID=300111 RepID=A0A6J1Q1C4_9HYME|nr:uncharacterized protein LOC112457248 [Temnothorax curvispinosus]XP_024875945.1 uncharacterized protein LOC112457248 [Temnothorax curvispinosus]